MITKKRIGYFRMFVWLSMGFTISATYYMAVSNKISELNGYVIVLMFLIVIDVMTWKYSKKIEEKHG